MVMLQRREAERVHRRAVAGIRAGRGHGCVVEVDFQIRRLWRFVEKLTHDSRMGSACSNDPLRLAEHRGIHGRHRHQERDGRVSAKRAGAETSNHPRKFSTKPIQWAIACGNLNVTVQRPTGVAMPGSAACLRACFAGRHSPRCTASRLRGPAEEVPAAPGQWLFMTGCRHRHHASGCTLARGAAGWCLLA